jgi:hypothetical protein
MELVPFHFDILLPHPPKNHPFFFPSLSPIFRQTITAKTEMAPLPFKKAWGGGIYFFSKRYTNFGQRCHMFAKITV